MYADDLLRVDKCRRDETRSESSRSGNRTVRVVGVKLEAAESALGGRGSEVNMKKMILGLAALSSAVAFADVVSSDIVG